MTMMTYNLRSLEREIVRRVKPTCPAYSAAKVYLPDLDQYVPRTVDWSKIGLGRHIVQRTNTDCWVAASLFNLRMFAKLVNKTFVPTYEDLQRCNFRDVADGKYALEYCMRNGVFTPRSRADEPRYKCFNNLASLSGYLRPFPLREQFLVRAIAQQPVLVVMTATRRFDLYKGGVYEPQEGEGLEKGAGPHMVNAIGYNDEWIKIKNTHACSWGEPGCTMRIKRRSDSLYGPLGIYTYSLFPYLRTYNHNTQSRDYTTEFNDLLVTGNMGITQDQICYCPMDLESATRNPNWPKELIRERTQSLRAW